MNFRPSFRFPLQASALLIALTLAACGGGGGDAPASSAQTQQSAQASSSQQSSVAASTGGSSQSAQATQPAPETTTVATAPVADTTTTASGTLARSGRSLNWWGIPPLDLFNSNLNCSPQPTCRIPDGDLAVWNATCQPGDRTCYVPLSTEPQVAPLPRSEETTALVTP